MALLNFPIQVAEAIRQAVRGLKIPHKNSPVSWCVTISLGVAGIHPTPETLPASLITAADAAHCIKQNHQGAISASSFRAALFESSSASRSRCSTSALKSATILQVKA
jgi:GGDEF domain-containing protein